MHKAVRSFFRFLSILAALVLGAVVVVLGGAAYFNSPPKQAPAAALSVPSAQAPVPEEEGIRFDEDGALLFEIKSGETAYSVGSRLEGAGVIRSRYFWYLLFRLDNDFIKTGTYKIELPATQTRIRSILTTGSQLLVRVTIPEGVTLRKTAGLLEEAGICAAGDFLAASSSREMLGAYGVPGATMEGYLYPDTYLFPLSYPADKVVAAMADMFFTRLREIEAEVSAAAPASGADAAGGAGMSAEERNLRIVIASIVEREYRVPEEAALMAGVFYNRLRIGMALQSCATVEYIITEIEGRPHPEVLYNRDIEIRNPYNTYLRPGLPPGPISAPGETALKAAFLPDVTDYLYFRLIDTDSGKHYFSRTFDDHIKAGALYVKGR